MLAGPRLKGLGIDAPTPGVGQQGDDLIRGPQDVRDEESHGLDALQLFRMDLLVVAVQQAGVVEIGLAAVEVADPKVVAVHQVVGSPQLEQLGACNQQLPIDRVWQQLQSSVLT